jgi:hypothetical protein
MKYFLFFSFILTSITLSGQNLCSEITDTNFTHLNKEDHTYIYALSSKDFDEEKLQSINKIIASFIANELDDLSSKPKRKIRTIHSLVHKEFFKQYKDDAYFTDIFNNGVFNCVTGTMLFTIILEDLNIPYQIKEYPTHVNLVAYPNSANIIIESTMNKGGTYVLNAKAVSQSVDYLLENKLITQNELNNKSKEQVFKDYYFKEENINSVQLASILFYNKAIDQVNENKYALATQNLFKANCLKERKLYKNLLQQTMLVHLSELDFHSTEFIKRSALYISLFKQQRQSVFHNLIVAFNWLAFEKRDIRELQNAYNSIKKFQLERTDFKTIDEKYFLALAQHQEDKNHVDSSLFFLNKYIQTDSNRNNKRGGDMMLSIVLKQYSNKYNFISTIEPLERYTELYPTLKNSHTFSNLLSMCYGYQANELYRQKKYKEGKVYYDKFISKLEYMPIEERNHAFCELVFGNVSRAFNLKGHFSKSRKVLKTGLQLIPNNLNLKSRLKDIEGL